MAKWAKYIKMCLLPSGFSQRLSPLRVHRIHPLYPLIQVLSSGCKDAPLGTKNSPKNKAVLPFLQISVGFVPFNYQAHVHNLAVGLK